MKALILFILIAGLTTSAAMAQKSGNEVYPGQAGIEHNQAVKHFSRDFVTATTGHDPFLRLQALTNGTDNLAAISVRGSENTTFLLQNGYDITGIMDVAGNHNKASLQQHGSDLLSILSIQGNANQFDFTQQGTGLQNFFHVVGTGLNFDALQTNAGMSLRQTNPGSIPLSIRQTGPPTPVIISNNQ